MVGFVTFAFAGILFPVVMIDGANGSAKGLGKYVY